ncbi:hypothetical protein PoB_001777800 [Plakobranchus ocellatus]|uniref:Uncharacterized protein n=1 Tax=Plakobranchus ocellatus TaxID=259542 RepID=A0AAV3Z9I0_9GAST|nr:hypothetical protein PoB_001777800 [Plakobranchus ocellatus]
MKSWARYIKNFDPQNCECFFTAALSRHVTSPGGTQAAGSFHIFAASDVCPPQGQVGFCNGPKPAEPLSPSRRLFTSAFSYAYGRRYPDLKTPPWCTGTRSLRSQCTQRLAFLSNRSIGGTVNRGSVLRFA